MQVVVRCYVIQGTPSINSIRNNVDETHRLHEYSRVTGRPLRGDKTRRKSTRPGGPQLMLVRFSSRVHWRMHHSIRKLSRKRETFIGRRNAPYFDSITVGEHIVGERHVLSPLDEHLTVSHKLC